MTYHNAVKYLLQAPDEAPEAKVGARLRRLWSLLGNPQQHLNYLRLAGSSGKTVCSEMLLSAFEQSDVLVGCLMMPLGAEPRENIRIRKAPLLFDEMAGYVGQIYAAVKAENKAVCAIENEQEEAVPLLPTRHEILLTAALLAFQAHHCQLCIIETSNLASDPTKMLPAPFAAAVCGTIPKQNVKDMRQIQSYICHGIQEVVSAPQDQEAYHMLSRACASINCRLTIPTKNELQVLKATLGGSEFLYRGKPYRLSLCGQFQITNAMVSLEILTMLARHGYALSNEQIQRGLRAVKLPCKFEILSVTPTIIADSTHSVDAIETVYDSLTELRALIGAKLWLCLPDETLASHYVRIAKEQGYEIGKMILQSDATEPTTFDSVVYTSSLKDTVHVALADLPADTILLISGTQDFTVKVRYEILKKLGF